MLNHKKRIKFRITLMALILGISVIVAGQVWADLPPIRDASESNGKIYVIAKMSSGSFWAQTKIASNDISGSPLIGGEEVVFYSPPQISDVNKQLDATENAVQANALALVVAAVDADALVSQTEKAYDMGIPVITYDSMLNSKKYDFHFATNSFAVSKSLGQKFSQKYGGKGKYAVLSGSAAAAVEEERKDGFIAGLGPGWKITSGGVMYNNYDWNISLGQAQDILTANPDLKGFFTTFCIMCNHAVIAAKEQGFRPGELGIASFDMSGDAYFNIKDGWITASAVQDPYNMTQAAIKMAYFLATSTVKRNPPSSMDTNYKIVTPENIMSPKIQEFLTIVKKIDKIKD